MKLVTVFLITILLPKKILSITNDQRNCPDGPCQCQNSEVRCICNQNGVRENITFEKTMTVTSVEVYFCDLVEIPYGTFRYQNLDSVVFHDINELVIDQFAFLSIPVIEHVNISNVVSFVPAEYIFQNIGNMTDFYMSNVKIKILKEGFLNLVNCNFFVLTDVFIERIESKAMYFQQVNQLSISNSTIRTIHKQGLQITNHVEGVFFFGLNIGLGEYQALKFGEVKSFMTVRDSTFETTQPNFTVSGKIKNFDFYQNQINYCETDTFTSLNVYGELKFMNNSIGTADRGCLPKYFNLTQGSRTGNRFTCECHFEWFYAENYKSNYPNSTCVVTVNSTHVTSANVEDTKVTYMAEKCYKITLKDEEVKLPIIIPTPSAETGGAMSQKIHLISWLGLILASVYYLF